jgi:hypothetical protein
MVPDKVRLDTVVIPKGDSPMRSRLLTAATVVLCFASVPLFAAKATPLVASFLAHGGTTGVSDDGVPTYNNGASGVQCYFGVNGRDVDLVTYNTPRTLHFDFDASSAAFQASGITQSSFNAEVDIFGINYFGPYRTMAVGTTAQVQMDLEFYVGRITYELDYSSLAAYRVSETEWLITSDASDIDGFPGFSASPTASLNVIRRKSVTKFGNVTMPIRFMVTIK